MPPTLSRSNERKQEAQVEGWDAFSVREGGREVGWMSRGSALIYVDGTSMNRRTKLRIIEVRRYDAARERYRWKLSHRRVPTRVKAFVRLESLVLGDYLSVAFTATAKHRCVNARDTWTRILFLPLFTPGAPLATCSILRPPSRLNFYEYFSSFS